MRYVLGRKIDKSKTKALICIGINPSTAIPTLLDPTLSECRSMLKTVENIMHGI